MDRFSSYTNYGIGWPNSDRASMYRRLGNIQSIGALAETINEIDTEKTIRINFYESKNKRWLNFMLETDVNEYTSLIRGYVRLRSQIKEEKYIFPQFRQGKVRRHRVGLKSIGSVAQIVARYLNLPEPETYTSNSLRRSSASAIAESGVSFLGMKNYVGWKDDLIS